MPDNEYNPMPHERNDEPTTGRDLARRDEAGRASSLPVDEASADYLELLRVLSSDSPDGDEDETSASRAVPLDVYLRDLDEGESA